jgi:hypothetical protein
MTTNELRLIALIRGAEHPDAALQTAVNIILSVLQLPQSSEVSSPDDEETPGEITQ